MAVSESPHSSPNCPRCGAAGAAGVTHVCPPLGSDSWTPPTHPGGTLVERLRFRAASAEVNQQGITAALHREAADEIEALQVQVNEDRILRWSLRSRLDVALARLEKLGVTDV